MKNKLDIVIPAYNAHNTINRTLASIAIQNILDDIEVTIVNDQSDHDYSEFIEYYSKYYSIKEVMMPENGGPGIARQFGIDHSSNDFVTCIDADDTFAGAFVLKELRRQLINDPKSVVAVGIFCEEQELPDGTNMYLPHQNDFIWMFGKMYRRSFLNKYNIRFNVTRANEDNGFNTLIKLCCTENEQIKFTNDVVYFWHSNENSITRKNNCEYSYNQSFPGYTDNMIFAITEAKKRNPFNGYIKLFSIEVMCNLYEYYIETIARDPRFQEQNFEACRRFYNQIYKAIEPEITDQILSQVYNSVMRNVYVGDKMAGIIPAIGIREFFAKLKELDKDYCPPPVLTTLPYPIYPEGYKPKADKEESEKTEEATTASDTAEEPKKPTRRKSNKISVLAE